MYFSVNHPEKQTQVHEDTKSANDKTAQRRLDVHVRCRFKSFNDHRIRQTPGRGIHPGTQTAMPTAIHAHYLQLYFQLPCFTTTHQICCPVAVAMERIISIEYCSTSSWNTHFHELIGSYRESCPTKKRPTLWPLTAHCSLLTAHA